MRSTQVVEVPAFAGLSFAAGFSLVPDDVDEESADGVDVGVDESDDEPPLSPAAVGLGSAGRDVVPPERLSVL
jgi:hypothetical protein